MTPKSERADILLVDDDPVIRLMLGEGIKAERFKITALADGQHTLATCADKHFDLAIIDQELPDTSGLELSRTLKQKYSIPFIFLTASDDFATISAASELGALGYMIKPVTPVQMAAEIDATLSRSKEINNLGKAIEVSGIVSVALGLIMHSLQLNREEALNRLRSYCRPRNLPLKTLSEELVDVFETAIDRGSVDELDPDQVELLGINSAHFRGLGKDSH